MTIRTVFSTRRAILAGSAAISASALALRSGAAAQPSDRELIALLSAVERVQIGYYSALLEVFDEEDFGAANLPSGTRDRVSSLLTTEQAHLAALDGDVSASPALNMSSHLMEVLTDALALENVAVAAYAGVLTRLGRQGLIPEVAGIHSVEARHAAWLATLVGAEPFLIPVDEALAPGEALALLETQLDDVSPAASPMATTVAADLAIVNIADELGLAEAAIEIVSNEPRNWSDASLGCPREGELYAQAITPGFEIVISAEGQEMTFHADEAGNIVRCP